MDTPAINDRPVELDSSSAESDKKERRRGHDGLVGLGEEEDIHAEFLGEKGEVGAGREIREVCTIFLHSYYCPPFALPLRILFLFR